VSLRTREGLWPSEYFADKGRGVNFCNCVCTSYMYTPSSTKLFHSTHTQSNFSKPFDHFNRKKSLVIINFYSRVHKSVAQRMFSLFDPAHPGCPGNPFKHDLVRVIVPPPHVTKQLDQGLHCPHTAQNEKLNLVVHLKVCDKSFDRWIMLQDS